MDTSICPAVCRNEGIINAQEILRYWREMARNERTIKEYLRPGTALKIVPKCAEIERLLISQNCDETVTECDGMN
jgi:hypothetical protein